MKAKKPLELHLYSDWTFREHSKNILEIVIDLIEVTAVPGRLTEFSSVASILSSTTK